MDITTELVSGIGPAGLDFWMAVVASECDRVRQSLTPDSVHDLRVALRRCRSIADGFIALDPHPAWKMMKCESKKFFGRFGALRDVQVMMDWVRRISPEPDDTAWALYRHLKNKEQLHKETAAKAVVEFDLKKWAGWSRQLSSRTKQVPLEGPVFRHLALERLVEARELHRQAMRNRSQPAYHRLRIALKKFRYIVENFLPERHVRWGADLRELQDLLGEVHDLDVLWRTALSIRAFPDEKTGTDWRRRINEESTARVNRYRAKMLGEGSLFHSWSSELPGPGEIEEAAVERLRTWTLFRDPDRSHPERVLKIALQIYEGLQSANLVNDGESNRERQILKCAALAHAVGISKSPKKHQLESCRLVRKISPWPGLDRDLLRHISLVIRFHRGALPLPERNAWIGIPKEQIDRLVLLCGILRLANALDEIQGRRVFRLSFERAGDVLYLTVQGYSPNSKAAERIAGARHLLETACRIAIIIR